MCSDLSLYSLLSRYGRFHAVMLILACLSQPVMADDQGLQQLVLAIKSGEQFEVAGEVVASGRIVPELYERTGHQRLWNNTAMDQLIEAIEAAYDEGLNPQDYHLSKLKEMRANFDELASEELNQLDVLLSDGLFLLAYHLLNGKVDPTDLYPTWNFSRQRLNQDPLTVMQQAIENEEVKGILESFKPVHPWYKAFKNALARYRTIDNEGGWPVIAAGVTLKIGVVDPQVVLLRDRLRATGDYTGYDDTSREFDGELEAAVLRFQHRHHLEQDGAVGHKTLKALNVPVQQRINQIMVNLERLRWVLHDLPKTFIVADIAGFQLYFYRNHQLIWQTPTQVGRQYRQTPVFRDEIEYLVFNPDWTIPPTILREDVIPMVKKDISYLRQKNYQIIDHNGQVVDPTRIDWSQITPRFFPYQIKQVPGPNNALGKVKFIFPNPYSIFFHDTPNQALFDRADRGVSSGCIRVADPMRLSELLLKENDGWDRDKIDQVLATGKTFRVILKERMPVVLLYWTVQVNDDGSVMFREDLYQRDDKVLQALRKPFNVYASDR